VPDIPGDSTTTAVITVSGTVRDVLEVDGDRDWFRIELTAGQTVRIALNGAGTTPLSDTYLRLYDASGNLLREDDDSGPELNSLLNFTVTASGTYFIGVGGFSDSRTGEYQLSVTPVTLPPLWTLDQMADQLVYGFWGGSSHSFNVTQGSNLTVNITSLTAEGQFFARAALGMWSDILGVNFLEVLTGGQITFDDDEAGAFASSNYSSGTISSSHINVNTAWIAGDGTHLNSYSLQTYIHEVGHALGLGHAGNYNSTADYPVDALFRNDSWNNSIMSYFSQTQNSYFRDQGFSTGHILTPQAADILAISLLYGLSASTRVGDTTYGFNSTANREIFDAVRFPSMAYTIFDSAGTDTLDYSGFSANQLIDLNPEAFSNVGGRMGNVVIARGTVIENAIAGSGNDQLVGNAADNRLLGGAGNDVLDGGAGNDTLSGGAGGDTLRGGEGDDTMDGGEGADQISGGGGNDRIDSRAGADAISGDAGDDRVTISAAQDGIGTTINGGSGWDTLVLASATGQFFGAGTSGFENLTIAGDRWVTGISGLSSITIDPGARIELDNSRNPLATVSMQGGIFVLGSDSTLRGLLGSDSSEVLRIARGSWFEGEVNLGGGTDRLGTAAATLAQPSSPFGGMVSGGAGYDELLLGTADGTPDIVEHYHVDLSKLVDFELLSFQTGALPNSPRFVADVTILGARSFSTINLGAFGKYSLGLAALADASVQVGEGSEFTLQAGTLVGQILVAAADPDLARGYDFRSVSIVNAGEVRGNLFLGVGDDRYDGRSGSIGGVLSGGAGNDTLLGGSGAERMDGGAGADLLGGGVGNDTLTGGAGGDTFLGTRTEMAGDLITDLEGDDRLVFSDASLGDFTFSLSGNVLSFAGGSLTLGSVPVGRLVASAAGSGGVELRLTTAAVVRSDFNGDGRSDLLWRDGTGTLTNWLGQPSGGFSGNTSNLFLSVDPSWRIAGTGDFNGDGRTDILWRHDGGALTNWLGQASGGLAFNNDAAFNQVATSWRVVGTGDFNGDGRDDILWRHEGGALTNWLGQANGGYVANNGNAFHGVDNSWLVVGTGDFNGDGRSDILWRHTSGTVTDWLGQAHGGYAGNADASYGADNSWKVVGTGDFNGDGRDDVLWRHDSGGLINWLGQANGGLSSNGSAFNQVDRAWHVAGIGDYNGDGRDDLLWRHDGGEISQWLARADGGFRHPISCWYEFRANPDG
jgi:serralysin